MRERELFLPYFVFILSFRAYVRRASFLSLSPSFPLSFLLSPSLGGRKEGKSFQLLCVRAVMLHMREWMWEREGEKETSEFCRTWFVILVEFPPHMWADSLSTAAAAILDVQGEHDRLGLSLVCRLIARRRSRRTVHDTRERERAQPWSVQSCDVACALRVIVTLLRSHWLEWVTWYVNCSWRWSLSLPTKNIYNCWGEEK